MIVWSAMNHLLHTTRRMKMSSIHPVPQRSLSKPSFRRHHLGRMFISIRLHNWKLANNNSQMQSANRKIKELAGKVIRCGYITGPKWKVKIGFGELWVFFHLQITSHDRGASPKDFPVAAPSHLDRRLPPSLPEMCFSFSHSPCFSRSSQYMRNGLR